VRRTLTAEEGRLDAVLARMTGEARADVQRAIAAGKVGVDGKPRPKSFRLHGGERVTIEIGNDEPLEAEGPPVPIRFEDEHLVVIVKPAGLVTHPTAGRRGGTLVNRLLGMGIPLAPAGGSLRPGIVHRLDVGTSGLMIVAKTDQAYVALRRMFRAHAVRRTYLALVRGSVANDTFAVEAPLGRRAARIVVDATEGRHAETGFEVRERFAGATLLEAVPGTGRTHQIRVHLAAIGHPILGDRTYGGGGDETRTLGLDRPYLHAWRLSFVHPVSGGRVELEEALPAELESTLARLRSPGSLDGAEAAT
jgi:23S rRNA pseudouridine1911/1915/1917 synthase